MARKQLSIQFALILLIANVCRGQTAPDSDQQIIRELAQQVKELQEKVAVLESKLEAKGAQPVAADISPAMPQEPPTSVFDGHGFHGIQWRGFGEVNYKVLDQKVPELATSGFVPGSAGNFYAGDFDLLLTSAITDKASVLAEVVVGEDDAQRFDVDLERGLFKYDYNDHLKASFGRYHTGIGYYNTAFHSGKWLQTATDRPLIMEFAAHGGLLPTQAIGVSFTGWIPSGSLGLNYLIEYGSSDTIRPEFNEQGRGPDDENNGNSINFGLFARPDGVPGLQIGGSVYHDRISNFQKGPTVSLGQTIVNGHVVYVTHNIEILNEGYLMRHAYKHGGPIYDMPAFYTQFSRQFGRISPYFRYQYINANPQSMYDDVKLRHGPSFGARYDFNANIGFKAQLDHTLRKNLPDLNGLHLQLVFAF